MTAHHYDDVIHGFFSFVNLISRGNEAVELVGRDVAGAVAAQPVG